MHQAPMAFFMTEKIVRSLTLYIFVWHMTEMRCSAMHNPKIRLP